MSFECPFYKQYDACTIHPNCVFNKAGGCAIELAAIFSEENKEKLNELEDELSDIKSQLSDIEDQLRRINR